MRSDGWQVTMASDTPLEISIGFPVRPAKRQSNLPYLVAHRTVGAAPYICAHGRACQSPPTCRRS
jgi:4-hydroxy-tetrahydrodipicolinate reductase